MDKSCTMDEVDKEETKTDLINVKKELVDENEYENYTEDAYNDFISDTNDVKQELLDEIAGWNESDISKMNVYGISENSGDPLSIQDFKKEETEADVSERKVGLDDDASCEMKTEDLQNFLATAEQSSSIDDAIDEGTCSKLRFLSSLFVSF